MGNKWIRMSWSHQAS